MASQTPPSKKQRLAVPLNFFSKEFLLQHIKDILKFYEPRVINPAGGYFQSFYTNGTTFNPSFQQIVSSARMVINFCMAGKVLQRPELLKIGQHGLDFLEKVHYVPDQRIYSFTVRDQQPEDMTQQAYAYAFILAAHASARVSEVTTSNADIERIFEDLEKRFWLPEKRAYLDTISAEGVVDNSYRGQNSNMHMCEAMIAAYEATKDERYLDRAEVLVTTFTVDLASKADGFVYEHYTVDFEVDYEYNKNDPTNIYRAWGFQPGHQFEWAKNLLNIYRHRPKEWMLTRSQELFNGAWKLSWDSMHGGLVYGFGPDKTWCDDDKYFWVQSECMATLALLYEATKEPSYLERYVHIWRYCWEHWVDHEHGAWLCFKMTRDHHRSNDEKAIAGGKCDYHTLVTSIEALRAFKA